MTARSVARPSTGRRPRLALLGAALSLIATGVTTTVTAGPAHAAQWVQLGGVANDIGISPLGVVWATGKDGKVFRLEGNQWVDKNFPAFAVRITVDLSGNAWVVKSNKTISRWTGSGWQTVYGLANDLGNGGGGQIWRASDTGVVYAWNWSTNAWNNRGGADVVRIDAEVGGIAWAVQSDGDVYRWNGGSNWLLQPGQAQDIGLGAAGNPWATLEGTTDLPIFEFVGGTWQNRGGAARNVEVDQNGVPWVVQNSGAIWVFI